MSFISKKISSFFSLKEEEVIRLDRGIYCLKTADASICPLKSLAETGTAGLCIVKEDALQRLPDWVDKTRYSVLPITAKDGSFLRVYQTRKDRDFSEEKFQEENRERATLLFSNAGAGQLVDGRVVWAIAALQRIGVVGTRWWRKTPTGATGVVVVQNRDGSQVYRLAEVSTSGWKPSAGQYMGYQWYPCPAPTEAPPENKWRVYLSLPEEKLKDKPADGSDGPSPKEEFWKELSSWVEASTYGPWITSSIGEEFSACEEA